MIRLLFKYYFRYLIFTNFLMIVLLVFFDFHEKTVFDLITFLYLFFLSPFFCNAINSNHMWNAKINHLYSISKGRLLLVSNITNVAFTLSFFSVFLFMEVLQFSGFDFVDNLLKFFIKLLMAVVVGNFISINFSQYYHKILYKILLNFLFITLLSMMFSVNHFFHFNRIAEVITLFFVILIIDFSQYKKLYFYYDYN